MVRNDENKGPILRGRDIKKYGFENHNRWLIFIPWHFPLHNNPEIVGASNEAEMSFKEQYPAVYLHLERYKDALKNETKQRRAFDMSGMHFKGGGQNIGRIFLSRKSSTQT